ncbi:hypothetical protein BDW42DRAFT_159661 [Aspergillus taichungensis]|uniref:Ketoreductase (KR) domain-containing protein n=1 Tax=Aspergillus taichungensis TaxID=482145 RepID=A0A2J5I7S0_9EURO|nr:hypothetical protein BDW42DRAFT_159661 [Aspergillus taichungensis]
MIGRTGCSVSEKHLDYIATFDYTVAICGHSSQINYTVASTSFDGLAQYRRQRGSDIGPRSRCCQRD